MLLLKVKFNLLVKKKCYISFGIALNHAVFKVSLINKNKKKNLKLFDDKIYIRRKVLFKTIAFVISGQNNSQEC